MRTARRAALVAFAAAVALPAGSAAAPPTTLERTITGTRTPGFDSLRAGPSEPRMTRTELAQARDGRERRRRSLLYFAQLSDFQLADEESPARVESLDAATDPAPFAAAWRPQEALAPFLIDRAIAQVNSFAGASPVADGAGRRAAMAVAVVTGDATDNQELNEATWVRTLLEGGTVAPNSGVDGGAPGCPAEGGKPVYTGVQDYDDTADSPEFWDPDRPAGRFADWPSWPGLMDRAQQPFTAVGLSVPSYLVFGNHDQLVQGNQAANQGFEQIATGCRKPFQAGLDPRTAATTLTPDYVAGLAQSNPSQVALVPPDPSRRFVTAAEYKRLLLSGSQRDGHGFGYVDPREDAASAGAAGYYAFAPAPGVRFVVMESNSRAGIAGPGAAGNIDDPQFRWIERELQAARRRDEIVVAFSHTPGRGMTTTLPDESAGPCGSQDGHGHDSNPGCDADPRDSQPVRTADDMTGLFKRYPNVVAWFAGDTHENNVVPVASGSGTGYWSVETTSVSDFPQQARLVELMDNGDGTLSIFGTMIDTAAAVEAPAPGPADKLGTGDLAALSRTLSFNDPQGPMNGRPGDADDRNVELVVADPRRAGVAAATAGRCRPRSVIQRRRLHLHRNGVAVRGRAYAAPCASRRGPVVRVDIAVGRHIGRRCRFLTRRGMTKPRRCGKPRFLGARLARRGKATAWRVERRTTLSPGRWFVTSRARDAAGRQEPLHRRHAHRSLR